MVLLQIKPKKHNHKLWVCNTNHGVIMEFIVKCGYTNDNQSVQKKNKTKKTWFLHFYHNKTIVNFHFHGL